MNGMRFLAVAVVIALIDVLVPFLVFASTASFAASFLFWCVLTLVIIVLAAFYTRRWREDA